MGVYINKERIAKELLEAVKKQLGRDDIIIKAVPKVNDQMRYALIIDKGVWKASPVFYVDRDINQIIAGREVVTVARHIADDFKDESDYGNAVGEYTESLYHAMLKKDILENAIYELLDLRWNREYVKDKVYVPVLDTDDMALIVRIMLPGDRSFVFSKKLLYVYDVLTSELIEAAYRNTVKQKLTMKTLSQLFGDTPGTADECDMTVFSYGRFGATAMILAKESLRAMADAMQDDLYILPSSIHEVLVIKANDPMAESKKDLEDIIKSINRNEVSRDEQLSDSVFRYNRGLDIVERL